MPERHLAPRAISSRPGGRLTRTHWRRAGIVRQISGQRGTLDSLPATERQQPALTVPEQAQYAQANRTRRWTFRRMLLLAGGLTAGAILIYLGWVALTFANLEARVYKPIPAQPRVQASPSAVLAQALVPVASPTVLASDVLGKRRINLLILGTDKRQNDPDHFARSDTMVLVNLDPVERVARVMSIPRDLVAEIPGYGENKINSAYLFGEYYKEPGGGQALAVHTISQLFNVDIDYYVAVNFEGFRTLVDTLGGITVDVPYELDDYHYPSDDEGDPFGEIHVHFDAGVQQMHGKEALRYSRTRHADNDFMRSKRQLQVMLAMKRAASGLNLIPAMPRLLDEVAGMLETNIPFSRQVDLARLAYEIQPSDIITTTIDRDLVLPTVLPDGSEGLKLNWKKARPVLSEFFGTSEEAQDFTGSETPVAQKSVTSGGANGQRLTGSNTAPIRKTGPSAKSPTGTARKATPTPTVRTHPRKP